MICINPRINPAFTKMIDGTEKPKIPSKFSKRAARYNEFRYKRQAMHCPFTSKLHHCSQHLRWSFYRYASFRTFSDSVYMSLSPHTAGRFSFSNWFAHLSRHHCDLSQRRIQSDSSATSSIPAQIFSSPAVQDVWKELVIQQNRRYCE